MQRPARRDADVPARDCDGDAAQRARDRKRRAEQHAADERIAQREQQPHRRAGRCPALRRHEIAFRVAGGIGEMIVVVMAQVRLAINRVWKPHGERRRCRRAR